MPKQPSSGRPPAPKPSEDWQPADSALRQRFAQYLPLVSILLVALGAWFMHELRKFEQVVIESSSAVVRCDSAQDLINLLHTAAIIGAALLAAPALFLGWLAWRIYGAQRFPAPGMRVLRDTRVRHGDEARGVAVALLFVAMLCVFAAWWFYQLMAGLPRGLLDGC